MNYKAITMTLSIVLGLLLVKTAFTIHKFAVIKQRNEFAQQELQETKTAIDNFDHP